MHGQLETLPFLDADIDKFYKVNVLHITNASTYTITKGKLIGYISFNRLFKEY